MTVLYSGEHTHLGGAGITLCGRKTSGMTKTITSNQPDGNFIWENNAIGVWLCPKCAARWPPNKSLQSNY